MLDVLSIGNANIDIYPDKKIFPGGSANNFAIACSKLGLKTGFLACVGNDLNGKLLLNNLKKNNVVSFLKIIKNEKTGRVKILSKGFNKKFIKKKGANNFLKKVDLKNYFNKAKHFHLATPEIGLLKQLPDNLSVSVDSGSELAKYSIKKLMPYLKKITVFFANEDEAKKITNKKAKDAANDFLKAGVKIIVIKKKNQGILIKSNDLGFELPYLNHSVVDATGGGDAFASAFISALLMKKSLKTAANWGLISSSLKLKKIGAQNTPDLKEIKKNLNLKKKKD